MQVKNLLKKLENLDPNANVLSKLTIGENEFYYNLSSIKQVRALKLPNEDCYTEDVFGKLVYTFCGLYSEIKTVKELVNNLKELNEDFELLSSYVEFGEVVKVCLLPIEVIVEVKVKQFIDKKYFVEDFNGETAYFLE
jgi:hypothetical protein